MLAKDPPENRSFVAFVSFENIVMSRPPYETPLNNYLSASAALAVPAFCATTFNVTVDPGFPLMIHS